MVKLLADHANGKSAGDSNRAHVSMFGSERHRSVATTQPLIRTSLLSEVIRAANIKVE
jgi:hypothetical protein